jgi:hypothetical protein
VKILYQPDKTTHGFVKTWIWKTSHGFGKQDGLSNHLNEYVEILNHEIHLRI